jgi:tetratricopeptide (TPR) repeat protein
VMSGINARSRGLTVRQLQKMLLLAAVLIGAGGLAQTPDRIGAIRSALEKSDFAKALELVGPALEYSPGNAQLWAMQGAAYAGTGDKRDALASFERALKLAPDYLPALKGAAQIQYEKADPAAIPLLERLLRIHPEDPIAHGMLAVLAYQQANCRLAVKHFDQAGSVFDEKVEGLHAYAACLAKLRRFEDAANVFERALALEPDNGRERHVLAALELMAHEPEKALSTLRPLLELSNPDTSTLDLASAAYEGTKDTERAVNALRQAILLSPRDVNLYVDFATISSAHQSIQVGIDVVNDGIGLLPHSAPLYFARGVLYTELGQYDKAEADFQVAYQLDPSQSLTAAAQGLAAVEANDLDRALASLQEKLAHTPSDPLLLYVQADILAQRGASPGTPEFQLAMRSAKKAVTLSPRLGPARSVLAKLYLSAGQYSEAAEQSRKALDLNPKDQAAVYHLIQALRRTGDKAEIPGLLQRLALLRQQAAKDEAERYRYKLVEEDRAQ